MKKIVFIDLEVGEQDHHINDYGAIDMEGKYIRTAEARVFADFVRSYDFIVAHNLMEHDWKYVSGLFGDRVPALIDTLYLSSLLMPEKQSHALCKSYKQDQDVNNNPLLDAAICRETFETICQIFQALSEPKQELYTNLLSDEEIFSGFFSFLSSVKSSSTISELANQVFSNQICWQAPIEELASQDAITLAFALSLIKVDKGVFKAGEWIKHKCPQIYQFLDQLRGIPCQQSCFYCQNSLEPRHQMATIYGYSEFRTYDGEPLQEAAVKAAMAKESLVAIFPTGGGKSLTFQLPALIAGQTTGALTVVISPLQSLMKDQVDHLEAMGLADGVAINGLLNPVERAEAFERVNSGLASILYLSPESLRLKSIERLLSSRRIARFVIDEAHCFSAWGQDFRVDYLYIGEFIRRYQERNGLKEAIPVSCFTATAKPKVITDILTFFEQELGQHLKKYATRASRKNLHYDVLYQASDDEKYQTLRTMIQAQEGPVIVYVSRTKRAEQLAKRLTQDGLEALPYHGKMDNKDKLATQEAFMANDVRIIVATSAFGMGVDKSDVSLVVHYNISDSLENYIQEAGRAGRNPNLSANCLVLFNENDLDKHFLQLNQSKLSLGEIQQVWQAIKSLTGTNRQRLVCSALELARQAGWDDSSYDVETRVRTAVSSLEAAGYIKRGHTVPHIYANSILAKSMLEVSEHLNQLKIPDEDARDARRIMAHLLASRSRFKAGNDEAESRVDYLADILGIRKERVIRLIQFLREEGILADDTDLIANFQDQRGKIATQNIIKNHLVAEELMLAFVKENGGFGSTKQILDFASQIDQEQVTVKQLRTIRYLWTILHYIEKQVDTEQDSTRVILLSQPEEIEQAIETRRRLATFILDYLFKQSEQGSSNDEIQFSLLQLKKAYHEEQGLLADEVESIVTTQELQETLLYLTKIGAFHLEGGFLVFYSGMEIKRLETNNAIRYKKDDYQTLSTFYEQRRHQIHIVGEYARLMVSSPERALTFVEDYFHKDYKEFISLYFQGERLTELSHNMTKEKFEQLFGQLSEQQSEIIADDQSQYLTVLAGPGSGKTRILVHKMAALLLLDDIKHDQLMMLTFSRAAAMEFKQRLIGLIGPSAHLVTIKTFHSYAFDLLGLTGNLEESEGVVAEATALIQNGEADPGSIQKNVLVIDEAQDMDQNEWALVQALMAVNPDMRVIAVGDDDQAIYDFRGASIDYFGQLMNLEGAQSYELSTNYRSAQSIVRVANRFAQGITKRFKAEEIVAAAQEQGQVTFHRYQNKEFAQGLLEHLLENRQVESQGQTAILTHNNEEAGQLVSALRRQGLPAKLIQDNQQTKLIRIYEIRHFLEVVSQNVTDGLISDDVWEKGIATLHQDFSASKNLDKVLLALNTFREEQDRLYLTDFVSFLQEVTIADFTQIGPKEIIVSTIHKAKGKEFDYVYLLLNRSKLSTDEERRTLYVGLTRAKTHLHLHYFSVHFDLLARDITNPTIVTKTYQPLNSLIKFFTLSDVNLGHAMTKQNALASLRTGQILTVKKGDFYLDNKLIIRSSRYMRMELERLEKQGYCPRKCQIGQMLYWKNTKEEIPKDYLIPLPVLELVKD